MGTVCAYSSSQTVLSNIPGSVAKFLVIGRITKHFITFCKTALYLVAPTVRNNNIKLE